MSKRKLGLDELPGEVLELILGKLRDVRDLARCDQAAKLFGKVCWPRIALVKDVHGDDEPCLSALSRIINRALSSRHMDGLQELKIDYIGHDFEDLDWSLLERARYSLSTLHVNLYSSNFDDLWTAINGFRGLRDLEMMDMPFPSRSRVPALVFPSLTRLRLAFVPGIRYDEVESVVKAAPNLQALLLHNCRQAGDDDVKFKVDLQHLKVLVFEGDDQSDSYLGVRGYNCGNIERLAFSCIDSLKLTCSEFTQLRELSLGKGHGLTNAELTTLLSKCKVLRELDLCGGYMSSPVVIQSASLKTLSYLECKEAPEVLELRCSGLQELFLDADCLLKVDVQTEFSKLGLSSKWRYESIKQVLGMDFVRQSLTHLNLSWLRVKRPEVPPMGSGDRESQMHLFSTMVQSSRLKEVELSLDGAREESEEQVDAMFGDFALSSFRVHPDLICLKLVGCREREFWKSYKIPTVLGLRCEAVHEGFKSIYVISRD